MKAFAEAFRTIDLYSEEVVFVIFSSSAVVTRGRHASLAGILSAAGFQSGFIRLVSPVAAGAPRRLDVGRPGLVNQVCEPSGC